MRRRRSRRSHRRSWLGLIVALALALAACGGADRPDPAAFDPDAHDLTQLIIWDRSDSLILVRQNLPPAQQALIDQLLASELPGLDKYVVDLAAFPNPYRLQVIDYLRARYGTPPYTIVFNYAQIFDFHPADSDTDAYIAFKRALFGALYPRMAAMMDPDAPRLIDAREVLWGGVEVDGIPALEFPTQVSAQDAAAWINDNDPVIGVAINGDVPRLPDPHHRLARDGQRHRRRPAGLARLLHALRRPHPLRRPRRRRRLPLRHQRAALSLQQADVRPRDGDALESVQRRARLGAAGRPRHPADPVARRPHHLGRVAPRPSRLHRARH